MKRIMNVILVVLTFTLVSGVSADNRSKNPSPESIVTCGAVAQPYRMLGVSIPESINAEQCRTWTTENEPDLCSLCISSLENQGCKIVDTVVQNTSELMTVTYLLSCTKP
jgi:hypothetical protein